MADRPGNAEGLSGPQDAPQPNPQGAGNAGPADQQPDANQAGDGDGDGAEMFGPGAMVPIRPLDHLTDEEVQEMFGFDDPVDPFGNDLVYEDGMDEPELLAPFVEGQNRTEEMLRQSNDPAWHMIERLVPQNDDGRYAVNRVVLWRQIRDYWSSASFRADMIIAAEQGLAGVDEELIRTHMQQLTDSGDVVWLLAQDYCDRFPDQNFGMPLPLSAYQLYFVHRVHFFREMERTDEQERQRQRVIQAINNLQRGRELDAPPEVPLLPGPQGPGPEAPVPAPEGPAPLVEIVWWRRGDFQEFMQWLEWWAMVIGLLIGVTLLVLAGSAWAHQDRIAPRLGSWMRQHAPRGPRGADVLPNHYAALNIPGHATTDEIRQTFNALREPDQAALEAHHVLTDAVERCVYDLLYLDDWPLDQEPRLRERCMFYAARRARRDLEDCTTYECVFENVFELRTLVNYEREDVVVSEPAFLTAIALITIVAVLAVIVFALLAPIITHFGWVLITMDDVDDGLGVPGDGDGGVVGAAPELDAGQLDAGPELAQGHGGAPPARGGRGGGQGARGHRGAAAGPRGRGAASGRG